jgi:hypothetical protein
MAQRHAYADKILLPKYKKIFNVKQPWDWQKEEILR